MGTQYFAVRILSRALRFSQIYLPGMVIPVDFGTNQIGNENFNNDDDIDDEENWESVLIEKK